MTSAFYKISPGVGFVCLTLPTPGFVSVVGLAVLGLSGDGVDLAPGIPPGGIDLALFLLGKLFVGDVFFHSLRSFHYCDLSIAEKRGDVK